MIVTDAVPFYEPPYKIIFLHEQTLENTQM